MIRSANITLKYSNTNKLSQVQDFVIEYSNVCRTIIAHIFNNGYINSDKSTFKITSKRYDLDSNLDNEFLKQFDNGLFTQRMLQACGTQASSIIRSCTEKQRKRKHVLRQLMREQKQFIKLQKVVDKAKISTPTFTIIEPQIDSRFFDVINEDTCSFDGFIQLRLFKNKTIKIPFNKYKRFRKLETAGKLLNSIRLSKDFISFSYDIPNVEQRQNGEVVGADQGIITTLTLSDGQVTKTNEHGYDLHKILSVMERRKKGSKGFKRAQDHRENYINWSLNQLNLTNVKQLNLEHLFQIRKGTNKGRWLSAFTYPLIKDKLISLSEIEGFKITEVGNEFRSQRCSECGWTQKSNRQGKVFGCKYCGFATDADLNASLNLKEHELTLVPKQVRTIKLNRKGFFWNHDGIKLVSGEYVVPQVQKVNCCSIL